MSRSDPPPLRYKIDDDGEIMMSAGDVVTYVRWCADQYTKVSAPYTAEALNLTADNIRNAWVNASSKHVFPCETEEGQ